MRRFVFLSHTAEPDGQWQLNELAAAAGRVDVLCRNVQAAFFLSHGLREDVECYLVFAKSALRQRTVRIEGAKIQMLNPDERSTAARIKQALEGGWSVPDWKEVQRGLSVAAFGLEELLDDLKGKGQVVLLDPNGAAIEAWQPPTDPVLLLSDHVPFTKAEYALLDALGVQRISLGPYWYHGNLAAGIVQWHLDKHQPPKSSDGRSR